MVSASRVEGIYRATIAQPHRRQNAQS